MQDRDTPLSDWFVIGVIAFLGGVVANVIVPARRGTLGFAGAALIGVFCGGVAGISANAFGVGQGWEYLIAGIAAVLGDRTLSGALVARDNRVTNVHTQVHGDLQQNINQEGGDARQKRE